MRTVLLFLIFLFNCFIVRSGYSQNNQQHYVDSLLTIANKIKPDSNSVNALTSLQRYYFGKGLYDSTLKYAMITLPIASKLDNKKSLARVRYNLGMTFTNLTSYDSARFYLDAAQDLMPIIKDTVLQINCYNAHAMLSNYQSDYSSAIEYLLKAAELIDQSSSHDLKKLLPQTFGNIGHNLIAEKQLSKGIEYEMKALGLKNYPNEARYRVLLHLDVFDAYVKLENIPTAKQYLDSAILLNGPLGNIVLNSLVANNEGYYYQSINNKPQALLAYTRAYRLCDSTHNDYLKAEVGDNMAQLYFKIKQYTEAEKYAWEANALGINLKEYNVVASTYDVLEKIYQLKGNLVKALAFAGLYKQYSDSVSNKETRKLSLSLESKYQHQKRINEIANLTIANTQKELAVVKRNRLLMFGSVIAAAAILFLGLLYKNSRQKQIMAERETTRQQEQIKFMERQQQVVSLQSMINGQETERTRIARDLHDGLGGLFSTVKMYFSSLQHDTPELTKNELFQKSYAIVDTASVEVRRIAHNMMPEVLMKLGLSNALRDLCDNISAGKLVNVSLEVHGMHNRLNPTTEIMLFRIVQELLNNIIKHANATEVIIQFIKENERLSVIVEDNGKGFNTKDADMQNTAGIATIQSRVNYLNGKMNIDSQKNVGTTIMMDFLINDV